MFKKNFTLIILFNAFAAALFISYYFTQHEGFWFDLDRWVFYFFNKKLIPGSWFTTITAITNVRIFDVVGFCAMGGLYFYYFRKAAPEGKRQMILLGISMLLLAVLIKQAERILPISHPSPSLYFSDAIRLSELTSLPAKDASGNSFPGDHGMMLMIFAAFLWRYHGWKAFAKAVVLVLVFAMPRIMSGAHWFSDAYAGSLSIVCVACSWYLLSGASDRVVAGMERMYKNAGSRFAKK